MTSAEIGSRAPGMRVLLYLLLVTLGLAPSVAAAQENLTGLNSVGTGYRTGVGPDDPNFVRSCTAALRPKLAAHPDAARLARETCACTLRSGDVFSRQLVKTQPRSVGFYMDNMREYCAAGIPAVRQTLRALAASNAQAAQRKIADHHRQCGLAYLERHAYAGDDARGQVAATGPCVFTDDATEESFLKFKREGGRVNLQCIDSECEQPLRNGFPVDYAQAAKRGLTAAQAFTTFLERKQAIAEAGDEARRRAGARETERIKDCVYDPAAANPCPMHSSMATTGDPSADEPYLEVDKAAFPEREDREAFMEKCERTITVEGELQAAACRCIYAGAAVRASGAMLDLSGRSLKANRFIAASMPQCDQAIRTNKQQFISTWSE